MTQILPYVLEVGGQEVVLTPDPAHEFTATTEQVALGYGVTPDAVRMVKHRRADEFIEGKHYCVTDRYAPGDGQLTLWTKRGIVRLGFFIRSARARLFRDMAEDLVLGAMAKGVQQADAPALISARGIAEALNITTKCAAMQMKRAGIIPTHHFLVPRGTPAYLYPLPQVEAHYGQRLPAFQGVARRSAAPVVQRVANSERGKIARRHQPRLLPTDTSTEQLARRLLSLEAQKREVLRELATLA